MVISEKRQPKQARSVATRERLLDAAVECLVEFGYSGTSTTLVCQRAEMSRGAQLHHFAIKDELLLAALDHLARKRFEGLAAGAKAAARRPHSTDASRWIREGVDLLWTTFAADLYFGAMELWLAARTDPGLRVEVHRVERALGKEVMALFHDLFPHEITDTSEGVEALRVVTYLMRGLALTRLLRTSTADEERMLEICAHMLSEVVTTASTASSRVDLTPVRPLLVGCPRPGAPTSNHI